MRLNGLLNTNFHTIRILENAVWEGQLFVVKCRGQYQQLLGVVSAKVQWEKLPSADTLVPRSAKILVITPKCHIGPPPLSGGKS